MASLLNYGCSSESVPEFGSVKGFENHQRRILQRAESSSDYEVLGIIDEGRVVRVNVLLRGPDPDGVLARTEVTNVLLDLQTAVGHFVSISVWAYRQKPAVSDNLIGMVFYHAMTEETVYKTKEELK